MRTFEFLKRQLLVAEVFSIPVRIDYRWFAVWALMSWLIAVNLPGEVVSGFAGSLLLGALTSLVFFGSVLAHELAHAFVARSEGITVHDIVLHPFGGIARLAHEPPTPGAEFRIAIAGPGASFLAALFFFGLWGLSSYLGTALLTPLLFLLFLLNLLLAVFNLFPGYPLDGGRVLRAYLWRKGSDLGEATVLAGKFGKIIAVAFMIFGVGVAALNRDLFTGLWTVVVGLFLYDSAASIVRGVKSFEGLSVGHVMELPIAVDPEMEIRRFVDTFLPLYRRTLFPVAASGRLHGFLLLDDIRKELPKEKWHRTKAREVMRPVGSGHFIEASASVAEAVELMRINGIGALGVLDSAGEFVGLVERGRLKRRN